MTKETLKMILNDMAITARMIDLYKDDYTENVRECPFYSELSGKIHVLKIMGYEVDFSMTPDCKKYTGITCEGITVEI